ncbi:hypothetical protein EIP86_009164 [Pleurotus ostreatoroseus]|nr:hypothetical protein EIP86_009164 [Pleurotus ostreatoroseus]
MTPKVIRELTVLLPNLARLTVSEISWDHDRSHPLSGKVFAGAWSGFTHVSHLHIHECTFNDSSDVLRLLAALPALTSVELSQIVCIRTSQAVPSTIRNQLTCVKLQTNPTLALSRRPLQHGNTTLNISPYVYHLWALPHSRRSIEGPSSEYPGITQAEGQLLVQIAQYFLLPHRNEMNLAKAHCADHCKLFLVFYRFRVLSSSHAGLLTNTFVDPYGGRYCTLEVTIAPGNTPRTPGHVRWIQFRFQSWSNIQQATQRLRLAGIGSILSRFGRLEKIVLEYPGRVKGCSVPACFEAVMGKMHIKKFLNHDHDVHMSSSVPLDEIFDGFSFETIAESPVAYITIAKPLSGHALPTHVAIKSASVRREYSRQPHDIRKELRILSSVSYPNIISVLGSTFELRAASIHFWMPFIPYVLRDLLESPLFSPYVHTLSPAPAYIPPAEHFTILSRSIAYQLFSALRYLHTLEPPVAHRDVKPANLLIDATGCLKLVDFGIAWTRSMDAKDLWPEDEGTMCSHVCTGPYRAPETLFSPHTYDATAVDMWCAGATLAELFTSLRLEFEPGEDESDVAAPQSEVPQAYIVPSDIDLSTTRGVWQRDSLFNGRNGTIGLAWSIFQTLGSPTDQNWPVSSSSLSHILQKH